MKLDVQPGKRGKFPAPDRGWPHPGRRGWPHDYDRAGFFCVEDEERKIQHVILWDPVNEHYETAMGQISPSVAGKFRYHGSCSVIYRARPDPVERYKFKARMQR